MQLENYFDFFSPTDIRLKGTRVGIETILLDYFDFGLFPEAIAERYPTVTVEQVYATITYYWRNQAQIDIYLSQWKAHGEQKRREQAANPPAALRRLRATAKSHAATQQIQIQSTALTPAIP